MHGDKGALVPLFLITLARVAKEPRVPCDIRLHPITVGTDCTSAHIPDMETH